jgi:hypothetical protein
MGLILGGILLDLIEFPRGARLGEVASETVWQLGGYCWACDFNFLYFFWHGALYRLSD